MSREKTIGNIRKLREKFAAVDERVEGIYTQMDNRDISMARGAAHIIALRTQKALIGLTHPITTVRHFERKEQERLFAYATNCRQPIIERRIANGEIPARRAAKVRAGVARDIERYKNNLGISTK